jgi:glycolate oxidase iron-sulfur subunit
LLPNLQKPVHWREYYPPTGNAKGNVALFTGCISDVVDQTTLQAAIRVLNHFGYGVYVPGKQVCCGALHLHNGESDQARTLAAANLTAFNPLNVQAIITTSSGCGVMLSEYAKLPWLSTPEQESIRLFERKIMDISTFLYETGWPEDVPLKPLEDDIAIHDPCSLRRILRQHDNPQHLLKRIPGIRLQPLPGNTQCCGAAGSYMITHPEMADRLRDDKLRALDSTSTNTVVTSNIGCALHLAAGLRKTGRNVEVVHPVVLLDRQLI